MADVVQLPGVLNCRTVKGDEFNFTLNLNQSIVGHTLTAQVYQAVVTGYGGGGGDSTTSVGQTITQPTLSIVSATAGTILVGMSETQTNLLTPGTTYRWYLRDVAPGDITRTLLSGEYTTVAP